MKGKIMQLGANRIFAIAGLAVILGAPFKAWAVPMSVPWTSTTFTASGDSRLGDISLFADLDTTPVPTTTAHKTQTETGAALPQVTDPFPALQVCAPTTCVFLPNFRTANSGASIGGSAAGTIIVGSNGSSFAQDQVDLITHGAGGTGNTTFMGEFVSNGTTVDLGYNGEYSLSAFGANRVSISPQFAFAAVDITYLVQDLTTATTLFSVSLLSDSVTQFVCGFPCFPTRKDGVAFSGAEALDLSGTAGDTIKVTMATSTRAVSYAGHLSFDLPGQRTRGSASASLGGPGFNYSFTTEEGGGGSGSTVPEPATLVLLGLGLAAIGLSRNRRKPGRIYFPG